MHTLPAPRRSGAASCTASLLTLGALGCLPEKVLGRVRTLEFSLGGAVLVGETVTADTLYNPRVDAWEVRLTGRGRRLGRVVTREDETPGMEPLSSRQVSRRPMRSEPYAPKVPLELAEFDRIEGAYAPAPALAEIARDFDAGALDQALVEALAWASYVVGMELPGLHGIFAAAKLSILERVAAGSATGRYLLRLREYDARTEGIVVDGFLETRSGVTAAAVLESFIRPQLPHIDKAALLPRRRRPASGRSAVVIGGSRGFGAAATLALLGHGHETHAVSSTVGGTREGARPFEGIETERLILHRADARVPAELTRLRDVVTERGLPLRGIVLAAAPPPLPMGLTAESACLLGDYVATSILLAAVPLGALMPLLDEQSFILFCSSAAVTAPPRDWPHYAAAKGALERLADWTAVAAPGVRSVVARLPKMLTGMTNSPSMRLGATAPDAIARRLITRLESDDLQVGLTILEPESL